MTNTEHFLALKTAKEYRSRGYAVALNAPVDFLPGYRPNLVVRKGGKAKVIEVKSRSSLEANPQVRELARIIDSKPGWSFELLLVAQPERLDAPDGARSLERGDILRRVEEAEAVLGSGHAEAALLLAWSACEAAVRLLLADEGVSGTEITTAGYVLGQATYLGILSRDEYRHLTHVRKYRNAIVHGYSHGGFGEELVTDLVKDVRRMTAAHDK